MEFNQILGVILILFGISAFSNGKNKIFKNNQKWIATKARITKINIQSKTNHVTENKDDDLQIFDKDAVNAEGAVDAVDAEMVPEEMRKILTTTKTPVKLSFDLNRLVLYYKYSVNTNEYEGEHVGEWTSKDLSTVTDTFDKNSIQVIYYNKDDVTDSRVKRPVEGNYYYHMGLSYLVFGLFLFFNKCEFYNPLSELKGGSNYSIDSITSSVNDFIGSILNKS